ncbi:MAG: CDP-glycerol glycerophosphotransferase family protein, partial [Lachnospiraceae bacterium]|nr:CDP-glycerol glycerophosphotransferase family protein [Lachnospiraceae bacterium]
MKSRKFYVLLYISNEYYKQTLQSLLNQSIGFDRHINLILAVSSDFFYTEELKRIISQHFENISYLGQISKGEFQKRAYFRIKGKYVHYAECGSVYQRNTFKIISFLFSKRGNGIEVVLARYDSKKKNDLIRQVISRVPKGERIVDLDEYDEIPLFFWNYSFVRADSIVSTRKNKAGKWSKGYSTEIEELLSFRLLAEVFHANPRVLLTKQTLVEASPAKRRSSNFFPEYQQDPEQLRVFRENVIEPVYQKYKIETPRFIQYNLIRLFRWCATESSATDVISEVYDVQEFKGFLNKVINKIDDDYLMKINQNARDKVFFFRCKQNELDIVLEEEDKVLKHGETEILRSSLVYTKVELIDFEKNKLKIRVRAKFLNEEDKEKATFYAKVNHQNQYFAKEGKGRYDSICWDQIVYPGKAFDIEIPLDSKEKIQRISLFEGGQGVEVKREKIGFGRYAPISENNRRGYYYHKGWLMFFDGGRKDIVLKRTSRIRLPYLEARLLFSLLMKRRKNALLSIPVRVAYWGLYPVMKDKRIWLISDRADRGDDNGEAFLKYLQKHRPKGVYYYFVIDRKSEEGKRISKYARTITPFSVKHTLYHLFAEYIISSQANSPVLGVVPNIYFRDIRHHMKFVFLQHGVTKDDQSAWLNRYSRNIYGLVVATDPEYRSMFDYDYYYEKKNIWLTGFPRNDLLYRDEKRYITLMPTWRKYLMEPKPDPVTGRWILREDIEDIEYSKFYSALIQSTRLKKALEKYGYTLCMKPHPLVEPYLDELFSGMENVKVFEENVAYRDVFAWSDLILTDYSSTAFDFAYLRKPIIYTHFDIETFRAGGHSYVEGYFDYERDGFGEVAYTLDDTIDLIIDYVKNDCQPKEKYLERVNKTFAFNDKENSKRVLERLLLGDSYEEAEEKEIEKGVEEKVIPH